MEKPTTIRLLIFDLDGTLIDSAPDIITTVNTLMKERGRAPLPEAQITAAIGEGLKQTVFALFPETHGDPRLLAQLEVDFFRLYEENLQVKTLPFPGVEEFLTSTNLKIAVVTNKHERLARKVMEGLGLLRFPWVCIFGADTFTEKKPHPFPLLEAIKAAGVSREETAMIGDGIPDMIAARGAGVHSVGCLFGYTNREILQAQGASVLIASYAELPNRLREIELLGPRSVESL